MGNLGIFPEGRFIMEDVPAAQMMAQFPEAGITLDKWYPQERPRIATKIIVAGGLGMGDAIMLTPVLRALKAQNPLTLLEVACFAHYRAPLLNLPYIDGFSDWPLPVEKIEGARIIFLESFGRHSMAKTHHMSEVFADICNVWLIDNYTNTPSVHCDLILTDDERQWAKTTFPRYDGRKRLGLQVQASHRCRTWPATQMRDLMNLMIKDGWEVYLMGAPGEYECKELGHLRDLRILAPAFRESCAFLTTCDAFVGPDSGFLHAAGALGIPSVGLFATVPWRLRTANYPSVFALQGLGECSPCFHMPNRFQPQFPHYGPCSKTGKCEVMGDIQAERVKAKIDQITSR